MSLSDLPHELFGKVTELLHIDETDDHHEVHRHHKYLYNFARTCKAAAAFTRPLLAQRYFFNFTAPDFSITNGDEGLLSREYRNQTRLHIKAERLRLWGVITILIEDADRASKDGDGANLKFSKKAQATYLYVACDLVSDGRKEVLLLKGTTRQKPMKLRPWKRNERFSHLKDALVSQLQHMPADDREKLCTGLAYGNVHSMLELLLHLIPNIKVLRWRSLDDHVIWSKLQSFQASMIARQMCSHIGALPLRGFVPPFSQLHTLRLSGAFAFSGVNLFQHQDGWLTDQLRRVLAVSTLRHVTVSDFVGGDDANNVIGTARNTRYGPVEDDEDTDVAPPAQLYNYAQSRQADTSDTSDTLVGASLVKTFEIEECDFSFQALEKIFNTFKDLNSLVFAAHSQSKCGAYRFWQALSGSNLNSSLRILRLPHAPLESIKPRVPRPTSRNHFNGELVKSCVPLVKYDLAPYAEERIMERQNPLQEERQELQQDIEALMAEHTQPLPPEVHEKINRHQLRLSELPVELQQIRANVEDYNPNAFKPLEFFTNLEHLEVCADHLIDDFGFTIPLPPRLKTLDLRLCLRRLNDMAGITDFLLPEFAWTPTGAVYSEEEKLQKLAKAMEHAHALRFVESCCDKASINRCGKDITSCTGVTVRLKALQFKKDELLAAHLHSPKDRIDVGAVELPYEALSSNLLSPSGDWDIMDIFADEPADDHLGQDSTAMEGGTYDATDVEMPDADDHTTDAMETYQDTAVCPQPNPSTHNHTTNSLLYARKPSADKDITTTLCISHELTPNAACSTAMPTSAPSSLFSKASSPVPSPTIISEALDFKARKATLDPQIARFARIIVRDVKGGGSKSGGRLPGRGRVGVLFR